MTAPGGEAELRHWLIDHLVTTIGCSPDDITADSSLSELGVSSRDAVVLSGELSEHIGRTVSPIEMWEHPTIGDLAAFLADPDRVPAAEVTGGAHRQPGDDAVAVVGLACRFPGDIAGPDEYWQFLEDSRSAVGTVPTDRWATFADGTRDTAAALTNTTRWGSFLSDIDAFDAEYFDISPSEADKMDPQQRLLLEVTNEALENAGIAAESLRHSQTGVFAGSCAGEYGYLATADLSDVDGWSGTGGALSIISNRVSYAYDLRGPSVTIDTACSSSLVAIHLACQSLRSGESTLALAAGVNVMLAPAITRSFDRLESMSPTGQCHSFDASADGFVRGEGCGVVVLKNLRDAIADGDTVYAVVRGSAVNQDGRSNGLTAPNPAAQMAVLRTAYANAGLEPHDVDYVEAHGTGTMLGDPIEARALGNVLGRGRAADAPLLVGAVKSNLGHLEAAAGVAGFIKSVLAVQRGRIPANLGFSQPNPHIPFDQLRLKVVAEHTDWPAGTATRRAGVSSFGFGGTNAHVIIEQAPDGSARTVTPPPVAAGAHNGSALNGSGHNGSNGHNGSALNGANGHNGTNGAVLGGANGHNVTNGHNGSDGHAHNGSSVTPNVSRHNGSGVNGALNGSAAARARTLTTLVISAKNASRIGTQAASLADWLAGDGAGTALTDVAHTLDHHRTRHQSFATVVADSHQSAITGLRALAAGERAPGVVGFHPGICTPGKVFVYSGQGSQWAGMARTLLRDEPAFAAAVDDIEPDFVAQAGFSLRAVLESGDRVVGIERIQPVLVGVQLALTALWRSYGVVPDAVIGHSMGETTAAIVSGALSVADGLKVISTRSRLMSALSGQGAMALVELDSDGARELIADHRDLTIAVFASPRQTVIAGPPEQIDAAIANVSARDRLARRIEVDVASHHPIIDPVLPALREALADLSPRRPTIPLITTTLESGPATFDADYWCANLRNPVRFSQAITRAAEDNATFVEVSPHPVLTYAIDDTLTDVHHHSVGTLQRDGDDAVTFHTNLNATYTDRPPTSPHPAEPHPTLPTTPWHHSRHWITHRERPRTTGFVPVPGTLLGEHIVVATTPTTHVWRAELSPDTKPYPGHHRLHGLDVVPVSVLVGTLAGAATHLGGPQLHDITFEYPIAVDRPRSIQVIAEGHTITVTSSTGTSASGPDADRRVRHVTAEVSSTVIEPSFDGAGTASSTEVTESRSVTELLAEFGVDGVPFDWTINELARTADNGLRATVSLPDRTAEALLDASVHIARLCESENTGLLVPSSASTAWVSDSFSGGSATVTVRRRPDTDLVVDITGVAADGSAVFRLTGLHFTDVDADVAAPQQIATPQQLIHEIVWQPRTLDESDSAATASGSIAVAGDGADADALRTAVDAAGRAAADIGSAAHVVYVAADASSTSHLDAAGAMSAEVAGLVRQLATASGSPALWIVTRGVREPVSDAALPQSSLWGLATVIAEEQPEIWGGLVDLPADADITSRFAVIAGLLGTPTTSVVALDGDVVLESSVVPLEATPSREPLRCKPDAAYLVTGGLGALGVLIAGWLAEHGARRIVLAGRTALPPRRDWNGDLPQELRRRVDSVRDLEKRGVAVEAVALDVAEPGALEDFLARRDELGAPVIRGVVHAAGVTENSLVTDTGADGFARVMSPKIAGAQAIHTVFGDDLDFFHMTGTAGTVFGVPGQGGYAAANAYLDALARRRHRSGSHTMTLDWVAWRGLGFAAEAAIVVAELERLGSRPVDPDEAFAAWEYVDRLDLAQAVMLPRPTADAAPDHGSGTGEAAGRDWTSIPPEQVRAELETGLRTILSRELRISEAELESDVPFAELGLNSVMAMSIRRDAEQLVGTDLSATMLWNHPTIAALAGFLAEKVAPATVAEEEDAGFDDESDGLLDSLFDDVESSAGAEGGL